MTAAADEPLLSGLRVLDLGQGIAGPYCAAILQQQGAEVVKVEPPHGDWARKTGLTREGFSAVVLAYNAGKSGLCIDAGTAAGQAVLTRMAAQVDVVIQNFRAGVADRLNIGYEALRAVNPRLIYASISGHGQTGPWAQKGGFDLIAQGLSGIMSVTGTPGGPPVKAGLPLTDLGAGLFATIGVLGALHHRTQSGRGQHVDTSLVDAGLALSVWEVTDYVTTGNIPGPIGSAHRLTAPYQAVQCADGHLTIGAANDRNFAKLTTVLGHPEWAADPRFVTNHLRVQHRTELAALIEEITGTAPVAAWLERLDAAGIPCGPILNYEQALSTPQAIAREMVAEVDHPILGRLKTVGTPIKMSETPLNPGRRAPMLGEHTDEVLANAGYSGDEIEQLRYAGAAL